MRTSLKDVNTQRRPPPHSVQSFVLSADEILKMDEQTTIDPIKLNDALFFIQDLLDRSQIRFFALKETGKQIREKEKGLTPDLNLAIIELGIQKKDLTETGTQSFRGLLKLSNVEPEWTENLIRFEKNGVPIVIKIIKQKYTFLQNPNVNFYRTLEFLTPNPFDNYWRARFIVR